MLLNKLWKVRGDNSAPLKFQSQYSLMDSCTSRDRVCARASRVESTSLWCGDAVKRERASGIRGMKTIRTACFPVKISHSMTRPNGSSLRRAAKRGLGSRDP
jgi:hypothetical protein